jgi:hypothetical protein
MTRRLSLAELTGSRDACAGESLLLHGLCAHGHSLLGEAGPVRDQGYQYAVTCTRHWPEFIAALEAADGWVSCRLCGHYCDVYIRAERPDGRYFDLHVAGQPARSYVHSADPERARALAEQMAAWQAGRWKTGDRCR